MMLERAQLRAKTYRTAAEISIDNGQLAELEDAHQLPTESDDKKKKKKKSKKKKIMEKLTDEDEEILVEISNKACRPKPRPQTRFTLSDPSTGV